MDNSNNLLLLDNICKLYHPNLYFPISLDNSTNDIKSNSLLHIGNSLEYELSTNHLARHDMILIISNGSNGKQLYGHKIIKCVFRVNYLYKELVFTDTTVNNNNEYYYICPYRSTLDYTKTNLLFMTKNLNNVEKDKINDWIKTLRVVTCEKNMNMISTFLVQISNVSSLSVTNALIDTIIQNKANKIFVILSSSVINSNEMLYYEDIIKSIVENGYIRKLNLFVNFDGNENFNMNLDVENNNIDNIINVDSNNNNLDYKNRNNDNKEENNNVKEQLLKEYNDRLYNLFQDKECLDLIKDLRYCWISVPKDVRLIEQLLGVEENQLEAFSNYLSHLNGSIVDIVNGNKNNTNNNNKEKNDGKKDIKNNKEDGLMKMNSILSNMNKLKVNYSVNKLQNDLQNLTNINNRLMYNNRNKQRRNNVVTFLNYFKKVQKHFVMFLVFMSLMLNLMVSSLFNSMMLRIKIDNYNPPSNLKYWSSKLTKKQWVLFYLVLVVYYFLFDFVSNKFLLKQTFDKDKYLEQKGFSKTLNEMKLKLNDIKKNVK